MQTIELDAYDCTAHVSYVYDARGYTLVPDKTKTELQPSVKVTF